MAPGKAMDFLSAMRAACVCVCCHRRYTVFGVAEKWVIFLVEARWRASSSIKAESQMNVKHMAWGKNR